MRRAYRTLAAGLLAALLFLAGCAGTAEESEAPGGTQTAQPTQGTSPSEGAAPTLEPGPTPEQTQETELGQEELFAALAGESVMGLVLLEPTSEELALAAEVEEVLPPQEYGERMLVVPRLPDSTVIIQRLDYDQEGTLTGAEEIWRSQSQPAAVLLQQDIPEGYPTLRIVIQSGERTGTYDVSYYGKGDGRRDFYVWLDRED